MVKVIKGANHSYIGTENELVKAITAWLQKTYKI